ncbi:hypothetical protein V5O48_007665 [Marasmius crinis-equi]|uniref:Uncharacterized protein n=1 Tax=Marasmius crinis-equi TaxID=585013 RepID=A0ABR3FGS5_9AGAR
MIIQKEERLEEDAPPSYDEASQNAPGSSSQPPRDIKTPIASPRESPATPTTPASQYQEKGQCGSTGKGKEKAGSWWGFGTSRKAREVRTTVLGIVRDVVRQDIDGGVDTRDILESCRAACADEAISISSLLQEKSIEGHTPLYWAIINRNPTSPASSDLLMSLLSFAAPLEQATVDEIKLACLITSDQALFQRLRISPEFAALSGTDQMVLSNTTVPDEVEALEASSDEGAFVVDVKLMQFQKRMRVSGEVGVDFIARGRMWRLAFCISSEKWRHDKPRFGAWYVSLTLLENSPPTWIDSQLLIPDAQLSLPPLGESSLANVPPRSRDGKTKLKPTISIRLTSRVELGPRRKHTHLPYDVVALLESASNGSSLQYSGNSYIGDDDSLRMRLEAKLGKPQSEECVIQ